MILKNVSIQKDSMMLVQDICQGIIDKKGMNVLAIDVRNVSTMTDFFIIAEGNVDRHVQALCRAVEEIMKENGRLSKRQQGALDGSWMVLDFHDIVIHLFTAEMRNKYRLEEVWHEGRIVPLQLKYEPI